jgi:hypothetical protein
VVASGKVAHVSLGTGNKRTQKINTRQTKNAVKPNSRGIFRLKGNCGIHPPPTLLASRSKLQTIDQILSANINSRSRPKNRTSGALRNQNTRAHKKGHIKKKSRANARRVALPPYKLEKTVTPVAVRLTKNKILALSGTRPLHQESSQFQSCITNTGSWQGLPVLAQL